MASTVRIALPRLFLIFTLAAGALLWGGTARAGSLEYGATGGSFSTKYPTYYSTYGCSSCHTTAPTLNSTYGQAYKNAAVALGGRSQANMGPALTNIEQSDSDGDGYKNIAEITALRRAFDSTDAPTASVSLSTGQNTQAGGAGSTVGYSVTVTNNGNFMDSFTLGAAVYSGQNWSPSIVGTANSVAAGGTRGITVNVAISGGASAGQSSVARVTATSQGNTSIAATPLDLTTTLLVIGPRYVNASTGNNTSNNCTSAGTPCRTITHAMSQASSGSPGDNIAVAAGTYNTALGEVFPIVVKPGVAILGTAGAPTTVIDASGASQRIFNLLDGNLSNIIQGLWMKGGLAITPTLGAVSEGGALRISGGTAVVVRNIFDLNEARGYAGIGGSYPSGGQSYGGAIYSVSATPMIRNNIFYGNTARGGAGVSNFGTSTPGGSGGGGQGGAIYMSGGGSVINNTFVGNAGIGGNGGFSLGAGGSGGNGSYGAVYASGASIGNNIFVNNSAAGGTGGGSNPGGASGSGNYSALQYNDAPTATHNLFFQNIENGVVEAGGGGNTIGSNFLFENPEFIAAPANLRIAFTSPARGSGSAEFGPNEDFDGTARPNPPSRGAFEALRIDAVATDLNGDGKSDLLWRNVSTGQVYRMLMNGFTRTSEALVYTEANTAWSIIADADFNGDLVTDLLWRNSSTGQIYLLTFNSSGMPSAGQFIYTEANAAWKIIHTPDLDGDGKADLLWWNSTTGQVYGMLMDGFTIGTQGFIYTEPNTSWRIEVVGDFSGSGKANQLLWRNIVTGQTWMTTVTVSGGAFSQTGQFFYQSTTPYRMIAAADFNGDGKSDLLWRKDDTGQVYMMIMNGAAITTEGQIYQEGNLNWKIVANGDYNGDGKADLLWRNDTTGQVYMMHMNGMAIAAEAMVYQEANTAWKVLGPWEYRVP